jgi:hypothetical protein
LLAKHKAEVRFRPADSWFNMVDKDGDKAISIAELTAHLIRISFSEPMNFLADLKKKDEEFKDSNPQYVEEFMKAVSLLPRTSSN